MDWYLNVWKKYAVFSGRARRKEYWMFVLINAIATLIADVVDQALGVYLFAPVYALAVMLPSLAVSVRRLHDTNRSGWNLLWLLLPLVGAIVLLVFFCTESFPVDNQYGPNPKADSPQA